MALIIVDTELDESIANATTSLREALAIAAGTAGADQIYFDQGAGISNVVLDNSGLQILSGQDVTIFGDYNGDGIADVNIDGQGDVRLFTVESGATLGLTSVNLINGYDRTLSSPYGSLVMNGNNGTNGTAGYASFAPDGTDGTAGADGGNAADGDDSANAVSGIMNSGTVTLDGVSMAGMFASNSGAGSPGGNGGTGGTGGSGGDGYDQPYGTEYDGGDAGNGADGGAGGNAGNGGNGGDAAAIFNASGASLTVINSAFGSSFAQGTSANFTTGTYSYAGDGGNGGYGGAGGAGGAGGDGGKAGRLSMYDAPSNGTGGDGGNGGNGGTRGNDGDGGDGGSSATILNLGILGTSTGSNAFATTGGYVTASAGVGGAGAISNPLTGQFPAAGGMGGSIGSDEYGGYNATDGTNGTAGGTGTAGTNGVAGVSSNDALTTSSGSGLMTVADGIIFLNATNLVVDEGDGGANTPLSFNINRLGDLSEAVSVDWAVIPGTGLNGTDFSPAGTIPSGTVTFAANTDITQLVTFNIVADSMTESDETFMIQLSNLTDEAGGPTHAFGTAAVSGMISNDDTVYEVWSGAGQTGTLVGVANNANELSFLSIVNNDFIYVSDPDFYGTNQQLLSMTSDGITLEADAPFTAEVDLLSGVEIFTVVGSALVDVNGNTEDNNITGGSGNNALYSYIGDDTLSGGGGDDTIDGGVGADDMTGGTGDDLFVVDNAGDQVTEAAGEGIDTINSSISLVLNNLSTQVENLNLLGSNSIDGGGNGRDNIITGNLGANVLEGRSGNDTLIGKGGNDSINGGGGADRMEGGFGSDTYLVNDAGDTIVELLGQGKDLVNTTISLVLNDLSIHLDNLTLLNSSDINGGGNGRNNVITGNTGDNVLEGRTGNDTLIGNGGDDTLNGGGGNDRMEGGFGSDTYRVNTTADRVIELAGRGNDTVESTITLSLEDVSAHVENLTLVNAGNTSGTGNARNNVLTGNSGNNALSGNDGADTLDGGTGNDTLTGGNQSDTFVFADGFGNDVVTDFSAANSEKIDLSGVSAIVSFYDLINNHLSEVGGNSVITDGANTITLDGIANAQINYGQSFDVNDFIF